ncbi:MAG: hypothetical protein QE484_04630 [Rhizobium sp.]|nr:hypothetical protein [Rhizobium sp.]
MQIIRTQVTEDQGGTEGFLVEFLGDGGERVSVHLAQSESGGLSRDNALVKAQVILLQASRFGLSDDGEDKVSPDAPEPSDAVESLRQEQEDGQHRASALQEGLEDTYPASDPVSATYTSTAGSSENKH